MKTLELNEMENIEGGCSSSENKAIAVLSAMAFAGSFIPFGILVTGPSGALLAGAALFCAFE